MKGARNRGNPGVLGPTGAVTRSGERCLAPTRSQRLSPHICRPTKQISAPFSGRPVPNASGVPAGSGRGQRNGLRVPAGLPGLVPQDTDAVLPGLNGEMKSSSLRWSNDRGEGGGCWKRTNRALTPRRLCAPVEELFPTSRYSPCTLSDISTKAAAIRINSSHEVRPNGIRSIPFPAPISFRSRDTHLTRTEQKAAPQLGTNAAPRALRRVPPPPLGRAEPRTAPHRVRTPCEYSLRAHGRGERKRIRDAGRGKGQREGGEQRK